MSEYTDQKINLVINQISNEKYNELKNSGSLNTKELYLTPDSGFGQYSSSDIINELRESLINLKLEYDELFKKVYVDEHGAQIDHITIHGNLGVDMFEFINKPYDNSFDNLGAIEISANVGRYTQGTPITIIGSLSKSESFPNTTGTGRILGQSFNQTRFCWVYNRKPNSIPLLPDNTTVYKPIDLDLPQSIKIKIKLPSFKYSDEGTFEDRTHYDGGLIINDVDITNDTIGYHNNHKIILFSGSSAEHSLNYISESSGGGIIYYVKVYDKSNNEIADFRPYAIGTNYYLRDATKDIDLRFIGTGHLTRE